ncbi:MAG TPA: energy transducer TonB [Vicinamibacterales bacterium]
MIVSALALTAMFAIGSAGRPAADSLNAAKELYGSAAYEDALAMLTRLSPTAPPGEAQQIEEYESLCLYALGRTADAETAVRGLIEHDPLFDLQGEDASPRVRAMFVDVRKRLLPQIAKERYRSAKSEIDRQEYVAAESHLAEVRHIIDEARRLGVGDGSLDDLDTLADGFRELAGAAIAKAAAAAAKAPAPPASAAGAATVPAAIVEPKQPPASTIYDASDTGVSPPVTIAQMIPTVPSELIFGVRDRKGVLALTIAADGHVEAATMRQGFDSPYDQIVLSAARNWRYKPAMKDGAPVRYLKTIVLAYKPE